GWGYSLDHGAQTPADPAGVPTIWNVLPGFTDVTQDDQMNDVQPLTSFMAQARAGTLPQLSWIMPDPKDSEHPPALISTGQAYVTRIVNAVMRSRDWSSSAIFLSWDDWGGFYDHVNPLRRQLDAAGYGIRVPALVIAVGALAGCGAGRGGTGSAAPGRTGAGNADSPVREDVDASRRV